MLKACIRWVVAVIQDLYKRWAWMFADLWVCGKAEGHPVFFNQGLMPAGPPASELQMADAESLHKVGCCCSIAGCFKYGLGCLGCLGLWEGRAAPSAVLNRGLMPAAPPASEQQMADAESLHKVGCCVVVVVWVFCIIGLGCLECLGLWAGRMTPCAVRSWADASRAARKRTADGKC
jgi:hypothetical protein